MTLALLLQREQLDPPLGPQRTFLPVAVAPRLLHQLPKGQPEGPAQGLAFGLQPEAEVLSPKIVRAGEELAMPRRHRFPPAASADMAFEAGGIEDEAVRSQGNLVVLGLEPVTNQSLQLEEHLSEGLARLAGIPLAPEEVGQLPAVDGSRGPARQVGEQRQPDAWAG